MAIRFVSKATVKNKLPRSSNIWDGTAVYNPVSPAYESIATATLSSGSTEIVFSSIPSTFTHLQLRTFIASNETPATDVVYMRFNSDNGSNYSSHQLKGNGSSATANGNSSLSAVFLENFAGGTTSSSFDVGIVDILDYKSTSKNKTVRGFGGQDQNGSGVISFVSGTWFSTSAISHIRLFGFTSAAGTTVALYGIKGA